MHDIGSMIEFPVIYTFKIVGDNNPVFIKNALSIFCEREILDHKNSLSSSGKYVSVNVTLFVAEENELYGFYSHIKQLEGIKYYL